MRYILILSALVLFFTSCKKDKYTTAPQISFKDMKPDAWIRGTISGGNLPVLTISVTDAEGDLGLSGKDTSFLYLTNLRTNRFDSLRLPDISLAVKRNFQADIIISLGTILSVPNGAVKDTIYYDVYLKDFAKNKSNVLRTGKPIYYFP